MDNRMKLAVELMSRSIEEVAQFNAAIVNDAVQDNRITPERAIELALAVCNKLNELERLLEKRDFFAIREEFYQMHNAISKKHKCDNPDCAITTTATIMLKSAEVCGVVLEQSKDWSDAE